MASVDYRNHSAVGTAVEGYSCLLSAVCCTQSDVQRLTWDVRDDDPITRWVLDFFFFAVIPLKTGLRGTNC